MVVDRLGWPAVGRRFGVNAIAAYVGAAVMTYVVLALGWMGPLYRYGFADWMTPRFGAYVPSLAFALAFVASLLSGALPAWRASRIAPAIQLKSQ